MVVTITIIIRSAIEEKFIIKWVIASFGFISYSSCDCCCFIHTPDYRINW